MAGPCPWLAVHSTSAEELARALAKVVARAPSEARPTGEPKVGSAGTWAVAELAVGDEIHSWAQAASEELARPCVSFFVDEHSWGFDVFDDGIHVMGMDHGRSPELYGNLARAAAMFRIEPATLERFHAERAAEARDLGDADGTPDPARDALRLAAALGMDEMISSPSVVGLPHTENRPSRWHGLLPKLSAGTAVPTFEVKESGVGRRWLLAFHPDRITLEAPEHGTLRTVTRAAFEVVGEIYDGTLLRRTLVLRMPRPVSFKLSPAAFAALRAWLEPAYSRQIAAAVRKRLRFKLGFGVVFLVLGLLVSSSGELAEPLAFCALGITSIGLGLAGRRWPRRTLFMLDGIWALGIAGMVTRWVAAGSLHHVWLLIVAFEMFNFMHAVRLFRFWGPRR